MTPGPTPPPGPTPRRRTGPPRPGRLTVALVAALVAVVAFAVPAPSARAGSDRRDGTATAGADPDPRIRLLQQDGVVEPDDRFVAFVEVSDVPAGSDLAVDIYPAITTRAQLAAAIEGRPRNSIGTFPVVDLPGDPEQAPVQSGFVIDLWGGDGPSKAGGWAKRLTRAGVYPVKIRLRGPDNTTLETIVTYLLRGPDKDEELEPTPVALVPDIESGTAAADLLDDPVAPLPAPVLRGIDALTDALARHPRIPVTLAITPEVARRLAAATSAAGSASTTPSSTAPATTGPSGEPAPAPGATEPTSASVLAALVDLLEPGRRDVLGAPSHDIDPAELTALELGEELRTQYADGVRTLTTVLEPPVATQWRSTTRLDAATVDALAGLGISALLVPPDVVVGEPPTRPTLVAKATADTRVLVADPSLGTGDHDDPVLAAHQLVGRLAAEAALDDAGPQVVSVAVPRTEADTTELEALLGLLADNPFLAPGTTSDLLDAGAPGQATDSDPDEAEGDDATETDLPRIALTVPRTPTDQAWAGDLRRARSLLTSYASMVPDRPALTGALADRLSASTDRRLTTDRRRQQVAGVRADLDARFGSVSIPSSDRVTLGARDAQFPLVLTSTGDVPVRVVVELSASDRLTIAEPRIEVVLDGDHTEVPIDVRSRLPGDTPLRVRVTTPDGAVLLSEGTYSVRSTAVSGVGLVLTVGAGLFLAVWWGRHIIRARRHRGRHAR